MIKLTRIDSLVCSVNSIALDIIEIPNLVQLATGAAKVNRRPMQGSKSLLDGAESVGLGCTRGNASSRESLAHSQKRTAYIMKGREGTYLVRIQGLEQIDRSLEEITHFFLRLVAGVAARFNCIDASTVLAPLMRPKVLVGPVDINPVVVHVVDQVTEILVLQDRCDVCISTFGVAAGLVCAVTVVRPGWGGVSL